MFCIKCGKEAIANNFCKNCLREQVELFEIDVEGKIYVCDCGSYYDKGWIRERSKKVQDDARELIKKIVLEKIKSNHKITEKEVKIKQGGNIFYITATCTGRIKPYNIEKKETKKIIVRTKRRKCDTCVKISGGYHEAVIQVRDGKLMKRVVKILPSTAMIEKVKDGYDIKFIKKFEAKRVINNLREREIKRSFKHAATKKGKKLFRDFYAVR